VFSTLQRKSRFRRNARGFGDACGQVPETAGELTSADEIRRVKASAADPVSRFHYCDTAVQHLFLASDNLPRRRDVPDMSEKVVYSSWPRSGAERHG
jgi:hypothetical protein